MAHILKYKKIIGVVIALVGVLLTSSIVAAQTVTQGYGTDVNVQRGMIVGLKKDDPRKVEPINLEQMDRVHGIVVSANDSAVLLGNDNEKVYVATTGRYPVLVSDQNGDINVGDYITASSISGIGMKSDDRIPIVVGKATEALSGKDTNKVVGTAKIKDSSGKERQVRIARITVDISIKANPLLKADNNLPEALKRASELIAGKPVSPVRVYISLVLLAVTAAIAASLIFSAVRSAFIAIGRNPLSKRSIIKGMFQVVIIGLMVFISGVFGVYLLLKL
jgi:hypothetical protein